MGFLEENLLGYGKSASYFYRDEPEGVSHQYSYGDPQLLGSRARLNFIYDNTPTGNKENLSLAQPFYSLDTRQAGGLGWLHDDELQRVVQNGVETTHYRRDHHEGGAFVGRRINRDPLSAHRLLLRYSYITDRFRSEPTTPPGTLPEYTTRTGPHLEWNWIQADFIKETFVDRAERVEDINLGHQAIVSAGYAGRSLGSTDVTLPLSVTHSFGLRRRNSAFALASYGMTGRFNTYAPGQAGGRLDNTLYYLNVNTYKRLPTEFPFTGVAHLESAYVQNMNTENLLQLGGDRGLRGFKSKSFTGNKSILLNIEGRAFYPHEVLHLAYVGGACFMDVGQVRAQGETFTRKDVHASVGVGLRLGLTRSTSGSVYRFDVAYAVGPLPLQDKRVVFSIAAGQGFKRSANSYEKFPGLKSTGD